MDASTRGWLNGLAGVVIFAGSLPATRLAISVLNPLFLTGVRATVAALVGALMLLIFRQRRPSRRDAPTLLLTAAGCVVGYPLLSAMALQHVTSAHSIVFLGLLPMCTAVFGALRGGERPPALFWLFSVLGGAVVAGYAITTGGRASLEGDLLMTAAIIVCGLGYAEGARLSRRLGGWQVISWALIVALPLMLPVALLSRPSTVAHAAPAVWLSVGYVSLFSMLIGFVFWYRGLALGGIAAVGQLQLLQPFMGLALAAVLLHETVSTTMLGVTLVAVGCVAGAKRCAAAPAVYPTAQEFHEEARAKTL